MQRHMPFPPLHLKEILIKNQQQQERCEKYQVSIPNQDPFLVHSL